ncbi:MAG: hypothetical protein PHH00_00990 [Candidatus Nanoarchaeia archaeon]|nr:hypothetical protein [Candidatus Nanoarchaeia archaeon]
MKRYTPLLVLLGLPLATLGISRIGPITRVMDWRSDITQHRAIVTQNLKRARVPSKTIERILGPFPSPPEELYQIQLGENWDTALGIDSSLPQINPSLLPEPLDYSSDFFFIGISTSSDTRYSPGTYSSAKALEDFANVLRSSYGVQDKNMILLQAPSKENENALGRGIDAECSEKTLNEMASNLSRGAFGNNPVSRNSRVMMALFDDGTYSRFGHVIESGRSFSDNDLTKLIQAIPSQSLVFLEAVPSEGVVYSGSLFRNQKPNKSVTCIVPPNKDMIANYGIHSVQDSDLGFFVSTLNQALRNPDMDFADILSGYNPPDLSPAAFFYCPEGAYASNKNRSVSVYSNSLVSKGQEEYSIEPISLAASIQRFIKGDRLSRCK